VGVVTDSITITQDFYTLFVIRHYDFVGLCLTLFLLARSIVLNYILMLVMCRVKLNHGPQKRSGSVLSYARRIYE